VEKFAILIEEYIHGNKVIESVAQEPVSRINMAKP
jgi:hypothetical protein